MTFRPSSFGIYRRAFIPTLTYHVQAWSSSTLLRLHSIHPTNQNTLQGPTVQPSSPSECIYPHPSNITPHPYSPRRSSQPLHAHHAHLLPQSSSSPETIPILLSRTRKEGTDIYCPSFFGGLHFGVPDSSCFSSSSHHDVIMDSVLLALRLVAPGFEPEDPREVKALSA